MFRFFKSSYIEFDFPVYHTLQSTKRPRFKYDDVYVCIIVCMDAIYNFNLLSKSLKFLKSNTCASSNAIFLPLKKNKPFLINTFNPASLFSIEMLKFSFMVPIVKATGIFFNPSSFKI